MSRGAWAAPTRAPQASPEAANEPAPDEGSLGFAHEKALQTFKEGIAAFDRRDFEAARVAFLQTFALKPSAAVVRRNLGLAEIYSGHYLEGARRLARVIHTTDEGTPQDRARMLESLKKAEAHLERVTVEVNVEGAEIMLGGIGLGPSPLPFAWYLPPGAYDVRVSKPGFSAFSGSRVARAGSTSHLRISLNAAASSAPIAPLAVAAQPVDRASGSGSSPWALAAGGVLTVGGLAAGLTFSLLAADNADRVERLSSDLGSVDCTASAVSACSRLSGAAEAHDSQVVWATVSFASAGVAAVSTLLYALLTGAEGEPEAAPGTASSSAPRSLAWSIGEDGGRVLFNTAF